MPRRTITVAAPGRLHFGLISFGNGDGRQFGGAGVMVDGVGVRVRLNQAIGRCGFEVTGLYSERVAGFARRWCRWHGLAVQQLGCRVEVLEAPRQHVGLGVGTQLGLATATALGAWRCQVDDSPTRLASSVERGLRSAVGTYGFCRGGFIFERGKLPGESLAPLALRQAVPRDWRFVLISPRAGEGCSGPAERRAFAELPPPPAAVSERLQTLIERAMLPAAARGDCDAFGDSVYEYGRLAGSCFAQIQGGPYNGRRLQLLVERIRSAGIRGVGQSSWGPTIFAVADGQDAAERLLEELRRDGNLNDADAVITTPNNSGATVSQYLGPR